MSYVREDDAHEGGRLSEFRKRLSGEVRIHTGEEFKIFQDWKDISWGQQWQQRIDSALDTAIFLIPIITPGFFKSLACREEFEHFLKREKTLGRTDLILPVYYVECPVLSNETKRETDSIAKVIAARQYADWRELRFEPLTTPVVCKQLASIAKQIVDALDRDEALVHSSARPTITVKSSEIDKNKIDAGFSSEISVRQVGPSPKTEVPTIIVDAMHRGHYATLTEALKAAQPGTQILVRPGLYREGVVIDKVVEIIGDGERADIVIEVADNSVILFKTNMGRIANLTLRQMGGENYECVDIAQGRLDLEDCDITSQSLSCVAIHDGADPRLRRNIIHESNGVGVDVFSNGLGTLEENEIYGNEQGGLSISHGGNPTVRRNRITNNGYEAIWVCDGGGGVFEENDLRKNAKGAWEIESGSTSKVIRKGNLEDNDGMLDLF